jgi:membrane protein YqaA with SNARE-associated domain
MSSALIAFGAPGLLIVAVLDSAGIPIVGGVDLLLITLASQSTEHAYLAATLAVLGSMLGSSFLYFLARKGGDAFLHKQIASGAGKRLHYWFQQYGLITVFVPAVSPIPLPMKIPVFCAGALQVRYEYFALVVLLARGIRYFGLAYLAVHYGDQTLMYVKSHGWQLGAAALMLALVAMLALRLLQKRETSMGIPQ